MSRLSETDDERYDAQRERDIEAAIDAAEMRASIARALGSSPIEMMASTDEEPGKVKRIRREIAAGTYETDEKLTIAAARMLHLVEP